MTYVCGYATKEGICQIREKECPVPGCVCNGLCPEFGDQISHLHEHRPEFYGDAYYCMECGERLGKTVI
jgi:hypothetical protein